MDIDKIKKELNDQDNIVVDIKDLYGNIRIDLKNGDKLYYEDNNNNLYDINSAELDRVIKVDVKIPLNKLLSFYKNLRPAISKIPDIFEVASQYEDFDEIDDIYVKYDKRKREFIVEIFFDGFYMIARVDLNGDVNPRFYTPICQELNKRKKRLLEELKEL